MRDVKSLGWSARRVPLVNRLATKNWRHRTTRQEALRELERISCVVEILRWRIHPNTLKDASHPHGRLYLNELTFRSFSRSRPISSLHGLTIPEARFVLDEFMLESLRAGFTCIRVIHGRGHHSHKHEPILKENIQRWLTSKRMNRHVITYTLRPCATAEAVRCTFCCGSKELTTPIAPRVGSRGS